MDPSRLSAKFKKAQEWDKWLKDESVSEQVKLDIEGELNNYKELLNQIWRAPESGDLLEAFLSSERRLEQLFQNARLYTAGR